MLPTDLRASFASRLRFLFGDISGIFDLLERFEDGAIS
jgi:hypothetical protein